MFRNDHEKMAVCPPFSASDDAFMNIKESEQELEKIRQAQRSLMIQSEWCENYIVEQLHTIHFDYVLFTAQTFDVIFATSKNFFNLDEEGRKEHEAILKLFVEKFFPNFKDSVECTTIRPVDDFVGYRFSFIYRHERTLYVDIPMYERASYVDVGKIKYRFLVQNSDCETTLIASNYEAGPIAEAIEKWLLVYEETKRKAE